MENIREYFETRPELNDEHIIDILAEIDGIMDHVKHDFSIRRIHNRIKFKKSDQKSKKDRLLFARRQLENLEKEISEDEKKVNSLRDETNTKLQTGSDLKRFIEENVQGRTAKKVVYDTMVEEVVGNKPGFAYVKNNIKAMAGGKTLKKKHKKKPRKKTCRARKRR